MIDRLRELIAKWRKDGFYDACADELEALLASFETPSSETMGFCYALREMVPVGSACSYCGMHGLFGNDYTLAPALPPRDEQSNVRLIAERMREVARAHEYVSSNRVDSWADQLLALASQQQKVGRG